METQKQEQEQIENAVQSSEVEKKELVSEDGTPDFDRLICI